MTVSDFPRLYASLYASFLSDLPFWRSLAADTGSPVLELGSGTGRVAAYLAENGFDVTGLELDPAMIDWAETQCVKAAATGVNYVQADIADFRLPGSYRIALCPCNTFAMLSRPAALRTARRVREHLAPHGVFAVELPTPADLRVSDIDSGEPLAAWIEPLTGHPIQLSTRQRVGANGREADVTWAFDELLPQGDVRRHTYDVRYQLWEAREIQQLMLDAGFLGSSVLGGYLGEKHDEHSPRMLVVAVAP
jgi:SAM-dependent methyltransferase